MINNEVQTVLVTIAALLILVVNLYCIFYGLLRSAFSALYWFSLVTVFSAPLCLDLLFGLPQQAFGGRIGYLMPYASQGITSATLFALGHIIVTTFVYFGIIRKYNSIRINSSYTLLQSSSRLAYSPHAPVILGIVFILSSLVAVYRRFDLSRSFNDFLDPTAAPSYETYFFFASTPLIAIFWAREQHYRLRIISVALISVIVAYFLGIRYYMFPFIGYVVWMKVIEKNKSLLSRLRVMLPLGVVGWIALTFWGVVRGLNLRGNPLLILQNPSLFVSAYGYSLTEQLLIGNEFGTRVGYYDLVARLQVYKQFRGLDSLLATVLSAIYPAILRVFHVSLPTSNAKLIYELQSGILGSGVSSGTTVFGSDWFVWGWWGIVIGGVIMGTLLALGDICYFRNGTGWILIGPMWTYQLIFFARGGTDVWLGLWGRFMPLSLVFLLIAIALDSRMTRTVFPLEKYSANKRYASISGV